MSRLGNLIARPVSSGALALAILLGAFALAGCGSSGGSSSGSASSGATGGAARSRTGAQALPHLSFRALGTLPAPVQDAAGAALPDGRVVLVGGLGAAGSSVDNIWVVNHGQTTRTAHLPARQHDAQAAALGSSVYVFGGGDVASYDHILSVAPATGQVASAGRLPAPASDVAVVSTGNTAYIVGGYTGTMSLSTIVAYRPGSAARVVGHLPVALRYAAVAPATGRLIIAGGSLPSGASRDIYAFDIATATVRRIGRLPRAVTHATAATLGGVAYVIGGRGDAVNTPVTSIYAIDPNTGHVSYAGRLPRALSDLTAVGVGGAITLNGGRTAGAAVATIGELTPRA